MKVTTLRALFVLTALLACAAASPAAQKDCGRPDCGGAKPPTEGRPRTVTPAPKPPPSRPRPSPPRQNDSTPDPPPEEIKPCEAAEVLVRCGLPGCEVRVDGKLRGLTNDEGELRVEPVERGSRTIAVSKQGYEGDSRSFKLACGASETANLSLKIHPVRLRFRTTPPEAEVFFGDPPAAAGRSDAQGLFEYTAHTPRLLVTARKAGYLDDNRRVNVSPDAASREVVLTLKAIPAQLSLAANVAGARVRVDKEPPRPLTSEPVMLAPGPHRVEVDALGYAPSAFEVTTVPGEVLKRPVALERLGVSELTAQAEAALSERAYENALTLCAYVFEKDAGHSAANRVAGLVYVARQDYARAEPHLARALAGGETVELRVRRHPRESFDLLKGHDACEGLLLFGKTEIEYRGRQVATENFKVPYAQAQVAGVLLKKSVAVYLATKVSDARGKKQDYNFYSFDRELTAAGRAYLELIQRLLRPH